ncbi:MAG: EamA family transporter [Pseudomonadota bacterium]
MFLAVLIAMAWGFSFVMISIGIESIPPLLLSAIRFTLVAIPAVFFLPPPRISWRAVVAFGFVLGVLKFSFLFVGMDVGMSAGLASLIIQSQAFFTLILAALLLRRKPLRRQLCGVVVAFIGIGLVATTVDASSTPAGFTLVLLAAVAWAFANIILDEAGDAQMLNLVVWMSLVPPVPLFMLSLYVEGADAALKVIESVEWSAIAAVIYITYIGTTLGFAGWGRLIAKYGADRIAPFALLIPVFGMASSAFVLGESFGLTRTCGALLVLGGLVLTVWSKRPSTR